MLRWLCSPRLLVYLALSLTLCLSLLLPPGPAAAQTPIQQASAPQTLNFVNGVAVVQGTAGFNQPQVYLFFGAQGQNIRVQLSSQPAGANFEVASQDNNTVYKSFADPSLDWSYVLPASQNYRVTINSVTPVVFTLTVTLGERRRRRCPAHQLCAGPDLRAGKRYRRLRPEPAVRVLRQRRPAGPYRRDFAGQRCQFRRYRRHRRRHLQVAGRPYPRLDIYAANEPGLPDHGVGRVIRELHAAGLSAQPAAAADGAHYLCTWAEHQSRVG